MDLCQRSSRPRRQSVSYLHEDIPWPGSGFDVSSGSSVARVPQETVAGGSREDLRNSEPLPIGRWQVMPKSVSVSPPESASEGDEDDSPAPRDSGRDTLKDQRSPVSQLPFPTPTVSFHNEAKHGLEPHGISELHNADRELSLVQLASESITSRRSNNLAIRPEKVRRGYLEHRPQTVRKLSGEIVRPALRTAVGRRPASMSLTPTPPKAVHFNSRIEHIPYSSQGDVSFPDSARPSPAVNYEGRDDEYPSPGDGEQHCQLRPFKWELATVNFDRDLHHSRTMPVMLETVCLSNDQKSLLGSVAVANIAFHKHVACRFTLDNWKTVSEICSEFSRQSCQQTPKGYDRFTFTIDLSDIVNLESKTLLFCIRYGANGEEFWDNNNGLNFQVIFSRKYMFQDDKDDFQVAASSPANGQAPAKQRDALGSGCEPVSIPQSLDASGQWRASSMLDQRAHELGSRRLNTRSTTSLASDNIVNSLTSPNVAVSPDRYDLGASLTDATRAAKLCRNEDALDMKISIASTGPSPDVTHTANPSSSNTYHGSGLPKSSNRSLPSASYEELLNKYCFARTPPMHFGFMRSPAKI